MFASHLKTLFAAILVAAGCLLPERSSAEEVNLHQQARIEHQRFASELAEALKQARVRFVYRLEPSLRTGGKRRTGPRFFHNYLIKRRVTVRGAELSTQLRAQLVQAVRETSGAYVYCFSPRHGLSVVRPDGSVIDFLICLECSNMFIVGYPRSSLLLGDLAGTEATLEAALGRRR